MEPRTIASIAAVAAAAATVTIVVADTTLMYAWWVVAPGATVGAVALSVVRSRSGHRAPWVVLLVALVLLWIGWTCSAALGSALVPERAAPTLLLVRNAIYVVAYPALGVASLAMVRARTGGRDRDNLIDASIVMVALATILWAWLFGTDVTVSISGLDRAWVSLAPLVLAAVVTASVRVLFAAGTRLPAAWLLLAGAVFTLFGNLWTAQLVRDGLPQQATGIDVLWILGFVVVAAAALHPSKHELTEPVPSARLLRGMPIDRLMLLGLALLAGPLAQLRLADDPADAVPVIVGSVIVALLAVLRVARLLHERDLARRSLVAVARRDALIANIGTWALEDRSTWELLADADELLDGSLPGVECAVVPTGLPDPPAPPGAAVERFPIDDGSGTIAAIVAVSEEEHAEVLGEQEFLVAVSSLLSAAAGRRAAEAQLRHDALHDPLTGLPNRTLALDRLVQMLGRRDVTDVTAIFLDLDGFKAINDSAGHEAGDVVLRDVADRLRRAVRADDTVARFAGDEFVVLVSDTDRPGVEELVVRLLASVTVTVPIADGRLEVGASVGVASACGGTVDAATLLARADIAMYQAKRQGGCTAVWAEIDAAAPARNPAVVAR